MTTKTIFSFVLMPFDETFNDVYKLGIKEAAKEVGIVAERLDEQMFREGMLERIYRQIDVADIIIADMTQKNPNVFYEVGYAHAKEKLCILITSDASDIPFDLLHRRHIVYNKSISNLKDELISHLEWAKKEIDNIRRSQIRLEMKPFISLDVTEYSAKANISFTFDLFNDSSKPSAEIDAIYIYSGNDWDFKLQEKDCPKIASDIPAFTHRYFVQPPVARLQPNSWAQFEIEGARYLATKWRGDEIKESYRITGVVLVRVVTNNGNFDYEFNLNLVAEKLPF